MRDKGGSKHRLFCTPFPGSTSPPHPPAHPHPPTGPFLKIFLPYFPLLGGFSPLFFTPVSPEVPLAARRSWAVWSGCWNRLEPAGTDPNGPHLAGGSPGISSQPRPAPAHNNAAPRRSGLSATESKRRSVSERGGFGLKFELIFLWPTGSRARFPARCRAAQLYQSDTTYILRKLF